MTKKLLSVAAAAAMVVSGLPAVPAWAAPSAIATYSFENGMEGLTDTGFGTAPSVVDDAERGKVLQFHAGETSQYQTRTAGDPSLSENSSNIVPGSPSSVEIANPYAGKTLDGITISMWVKAPAQAATDGSCLVGFVSGKDENIPHPDAGTNGTTEVISGYFAYGISTASYDPLTEMPMINFAGYLHNWFTFYDDSVGAFASNPDKWVHMIVSIKNGIGKNDPNNKTTVYIDGVDIEGTNNGGKRFNDGEDVGGTEGNTGQPKLMDVFSRADTKAYLGYSGSMGTVEGVCIDDVCFYDSAVDAAGATELYNAAKASSGNAGGGQGGTSNGAGDNGSGNAGDANNGDGGSGNAGDNSNSGSNSGSNNSGSNGSSSTAKNSTSSTGTSAKNTQNLPQTGVVSTGVLVALGAAAVAGGAVLFKKKENDEQ